MMKIKEKLKAIRDYYDMTRQVGHTSLMKEGVVNSDKKLVLVHKQLDHLFGCDKKDQVSWHNLDKLIGQNKPLVIDNGIMWLMLNEALEEIEKLEEDSRKLKMIKRLL